MMYVGFFHHETTNVPPTFPVLTMKNLLRFTCVLLLISAQSSFAERADRNKPINVEANSLSVDDEKHTQTLEGDVLLTQGTLTIRANKMIITEDTQGFQRGVASGGANGKAYFRQKREGRTDFIEGEGERIEYDTRTEVAELLNNAWVKSGQDLIKGAYIWYDSVSEKYRAAAALPIKNTQTSIAAQNTGAEAPSGATGRVRAVLQPQSQKRSSEPVLGENGLMLRSSNPFENK